MIILKNSDIIIRQDKRISFCVILYFIVSAANATIKTVLPISDSLWKPISILFGLIIVSFFCFNFRAVIRRASKLFIGSVMLFVLLYLISIVQSTESGYPIDLIISGSAFNTFIWWIPIGVFAYSVYDKKILYHTLLNGSYIITIILTFSLFGHQVVYGNEYNMFFSYSLILPLLLHLNEFFKTKKKWLLVLSLYETIAIVIYGSRGAILSLLFFVLCKKLFEVKSFAKKVGFTLVALIVSIIIAIFLDQIVGYFISLLSSFDISSRTLNFLIGGEITSDSGRKEIWNYCFKMVEEKPILGWGLGGEFYPLAQMMGAGSYATAAFTPHNGILQLWVNFGLFIGTIIGIYIIISIMKVRKINDSCLRDILYIFFSASLLPRLIVGSGIFIEPGIAVYLFLYIWSRHRNSSFVNNVAKKQKINT